jgi:uncharacterized metal-binding protein YceD (DUF177 family)
MALRLAEFVANPGRRFPVSLVLSGGQDPEGLCAVETVEVEGEAFAQLSMLYLDVTLRARLSQPCRRCLEPVGTTLELDEPFEVPIPTNAETVDLLPVVLRLILSAREPNVVCREDCRGLCPVCGANLNREPEHACEPEASDRTTLRDLLE